MPTIRSPNSHRLLYPPLGVFLAPFEQRAKCTLIVFNCIISAAGIHFFKRICILEMNHNNNNQTFVWFEFSQIEWELSRPNLNRIYFELWKVPKIHSGCFWHLPLFSTLLHLNSTFQIFHTIPHNFQFGYSSVLHTFIMSVFAWVLVFST